jgi:hypothetical protein
MYSNCTSRFFFSSTILASALFCLFKQIKRSKKALLSGKHLQVKLKLKTIALIGYSKVISISTFNVQSELKEMHQINGYMIHE